MRPKPPIILKNTNSLSGKITEVTSCEGVFIASYAHKPFCLRTSNAYTQMTHRYKQVTFVNSAHAYNLAERLNKLFNTTLFEVHHMTSSEVVVEGGADDDY